MRFIFPLIWLLLASACSTVGVYDLPKVQSTFAEAMQNSDAVMGKAQADFKEKSMIVENLKKANSPAYRENETEIQRRMKVMEGKIGEMQSHKKSMIQANGNIASLSYNRQKVNSGDDGYERVDESVREFETSTKKLNAAVADYSRESNSLSDLVTAKKLFYNFDVAEFQKRLKEQVKTSQENVQTMQKEIDRQEVVMNNWNKPENRNAQQALFREMQSIAQEYATKAQEYSKISKEMHELTLGNARVSTLDKRWPQIQAQIAKHEGVASELSKLNDQFLKTSERFRSGTK